MLAPDAFCVKRECNRLKMDYKRDCINNAVVAIVCVFCTVVHGHGHRGNTIQNRFNECCIEREENEFNECDTDCVIECKTFASYNAMRCNASTNDATNPMLIH